MENVNERIFQEVYREIVSKRVALHNDTFNWSDNEDSDEEDAGRQRSQVIIKSFPLPIGVELRRLFSISCREPDKNRLEQLLVTIEHSLQFVCYILVSQLWHERKVNHLSIPESFGRIFKQKIYLRNIQNYIWIIQSVTNLLVERSADLFIPGIKECLEEDFTCKLKFPFPEKNGDDRYIIKGDPESIRRQCSETEDVLILLLQKLAFLVNYKLVSVQKINVVKPKYQPPRYHHVLKLLVCSDSDYNTFNLTEDECTDSHSVMLVRSQIPLTANLNLTPFIIDTSSFVAENHFPTQIKKDIFMYDGPKEDRMNYKGCRVTEKCDMSKLPDYPLLTAQFSDLLDSISG